MLIWLRCHRRSLVVGLLLLGLGLPLTAVVLLRFLPPPVTPLMLLRKIEGEGMDRQWVPLSAISPELVRAVIVAEDAKFCTHHGFDWDAIDHAIDRYHEGGRLLGASTISMQTAKNVFLWPGRTFLRKGVEAMFTVLIEQVWGKQRIIEVYLNVVEWGHGIYGAEAAAQRHFHHSAKTLSRREAAALAAVLPNPRGWSPERPGSRVQARIRMVEARMGHVPLPARAICP